MSRRLWEPKWAKQVSRAVSLGKGFHLAGMDDYQDKMKNNPGLRTRWIEKAAVTKRAQRTKVTLAPVPSLERGKKDDVHGAKTESVAEADVSARSKGPDS